MLRSVNVSFIVVTYKISQRMYVCVSKSIFSNYENQSLKKMFSIASLLWLLTIFVFSNSYCYVSNQMFS